MTAGPHYASQRIAERQRWFWPLVLAALALETILWTAGGSGVARVRFFFPYPEGYNYIIDDPVLGRFTIQREDVRYITQYLSFLGNQTLGLSQDWPAQRNLYSLLVSGLWPAGYVIGAAIINLLFWIASALAAWRMTELIGLESTFARRAAVLLVVFHQGFLWAVGETNPHAPGYASGFLILGALAYKRTLDAKARARDLLPAAVVTGVLTLFYHSALLYVPMLALIALWKVVQEARSGELATRRQQRRRIGELVAIGALIAAPMWLFSELLTWLGLLTPQTTTGGVLYLKMLPDHINKHPELLQQALLSLIAGYMAFGPFLLVPMVPGTAICLRSGDLRRRALVIYFFAVMLFLVPNFVLGEPGYASVHLAPLAILLAVTGLEWLYRQIKRRSTQLALPVAWLFVAALAAYVNAPLVGMPFPLSLAWSGYFCVGECSTELHRVYLRDFIEERF